MYDQVDGEFLVVLARRTIETYLKDGIVIEVPEDTPDKLNKEAGVFVTLHTYPAEDLRGCIGYPEPVMPLVKATIQAAISAATKDPRFPRVRASEMDSTVVEVSVLTPPELMKVDEPRGYLERIEIGKHGLIVERGYARGLLLPQVPVDQGWGTEEFLSYTCMKAGMVGDCWHDKETKIYRFQGMVFQEVEPRGEIMEKELKSC